MPKEKFWLPTFEQRITHVKITENDFKSALPDLTTTMRLPELGATVEVYRDRCRIGNYQIADFPLLLRTSL